MNIDRKMKPLVEALEQTLRIAPDTDVLLEIQRLSAEWELDDDEARYFRQYFSKAIGGNHIELETNKYGGINCESTDCPFRYECAQHTTAGDFRGEGGLTPILILKDNSVYCLGRVEHTDYGHGEYVLSEGQLRLYRNW